MNWRVPEYDTKTLDYALNEWSVKSKYIISLTKSQRTVVQAGGNVGVFPVGLSGYFDSVYTFEPVEDNYKCLVENIKDYPNITALNCGLSYKTQGASIKYAAPNNSGAIRLEENGSLNLIPLDKMNLSNVDLLWLDIEGFEYKALLGAKRLLEENKPIVVLENNGLIHDYPEERRGRGSNAFRKIMKEEFNYCLDKTMMRDDIYYYADYIQ